MKKLLLLGLLLASPTFADEDKKLEPPTVALTQPELSQIVRAEVEAAIAAERARQSAASVYAKVQEGFAPKK